MRASWKGRWRWAGGALLAALLLFEAYARWPSTAVGEPLGLPAGAREVVLLFHGSGGADEPTWRALARRLTGVGPGGEGRVVRAYRWAPLSDNIFRAASHAESVGRSLGRELAALRSLRSLRLYATSAGSYVLNPLCEAYRAAAVVPAHVEMTFLDPIGTKGTWDYGWGYRNHGACADFARAYINTDDSVPGSNAPLARAHNIDVTGVEGRLPDGHLWPVRYYLDRLDEGELVPGARSHARWARGVTEVAER